QPLTCLPRIVSRLHIEPQIGTVSAQLAQTYRHFWCHRAGAAHNPVKSLATDSQQSRDFTDRPPLRKKLWQDVELKKDSGVSRWTGDFLSVNGQFLCHHVSPPRC